MRVRSIWCLAQRCFLARSGSRNCKLRLLATPRKQRALQQQEGKEIKRLFSSLSRSFLICFFARNNQVVKGLHKADSCGRTVIL